MIFLDYNEREKRFGKIMYLSGYYVKCVCRWFYPCWVPGSYGVA